MNANLKTITLRRAEYLLYVRENALSFNRRMLEKYGTRSQYGKEVIKNERLVKLWQKRVNRIQVLLSK